MPRRKVDGSDCGVVGDGIDEVGGNSIWPRVVGGGIDEVGAIGIGFGVVGDGIDLVGRV